MNIVIHPVLDPEREIDVTHRLVSAIAEELWGLFGGNDQLNWIEAEEHLQKIVAQAQAEASGTKPAPPARKVIPEASLARRERAAPDPSPSTPNPARWARKRDADAPPTRLPETPRRDAPGVASAR